jgi:hypothetical protein
VCEVAWIGFRADAERAERDEALSVELKPAEAPRQWSSAGDKSIEIRIREDRCEALLTEVSQFAQLCAKRTLDGLVYAALERFSKGIQTTSAM